MLRSEMATPARQQWDCREFRIRSTAELEDHEESLEAIVGPNWRLHQVTPLQNLQYMEARLKQYAMRLREVLPSEQNSDVSLEASFTALPELRPADDAPIPLQIKVESCNGANKRQSLYTGIMLSWTESHRLSEESNMVHLPVLLCKGATKISESVHNMLQMLFNCDIKDVTVEEEHLLWMIGLTTHFHGAEYDDLHLSFICPGVRDSNLLDFTVQMTVLKCIWKRIHNPEAEYITHDKILSLRDKCYSYLKGPYGMHLGMLHLTGIKFRGFLLSVKGHIKFSRELAKLLLKFVHDVICSHEIY